MQFSLISRSERVTRAHLETMSQAIMILINNRFGPMWGRAPIVASPAENAPSDTTLCLFVDREGDGAPGSGAIVVDVGAVVAAGGDILDDKGLGISVAASLSHEVMETLIDPLASDWAQLPDGRFLAKEACDPVQAPLLMVATPTGRVLMSNGVLPAYFDPLATRGPYDLLGIVPKAFDLQPEGYQTIYDPALITAPGGPIVNLWGPMVTDRMRAFKERPTGRTARRVAEAARRRASQQRMAARGTLPGKARS